MSVTFSLIIVDLYFIHQQKIILNYSNITYSQKDLMNLFAIHLIFYFYERDILNNTK